MKSFLQCLATLALFVGAIAVAAPALADPPPWAPAHGYRAKKAYKYYYYPASRVYYAPDRGTYFWFSNGGWQVGAALPGGIRVDVGQRQTIELDTERPYERHK